MTTQIQQVAVTGMGIMCALGDSFDQVYAQMMEGRTGIGAVERFPTTRFQSGIGAEIKHYDPNFHFSGDERHKYDLCAQYAILAVRRALDDSRVGELHHKDRTGLALGTCNGGIVSLEEQWTIEHLDEARTARYPFYQQGDHVADYYKLNGPVVTINTACAASGNAIGYAYDMIRWGYADRMIAGGSDPLSHSVYAGFNVLRALNPQPTSPFGSQYGLSLGEGAAFLVLEPLYRAIERGATIYAEICGYGMSNDAHHETAPEPEGRGIQIAVQMALQQSGVTPHHIEYINAHGTGTQANDRAEISGLRSVFADRLPQIPLSSSKAYFGHNLGAAAAIEFATSLYAIRHGYLPATLHHDAPREGCEDANIIANQMIAGVPAYMLNSNSAFGGHNVSIVARTRNISVNNPSNAPSPMMVRRVGIVGIGTVCAIGAHKGTLLPAFNGYEAADEPFIFSLKEFANQLYERRMNRLCQSSIGAAAMALEDAGWKTDGEDGLRTGFIYGTSRGSTDSIGKFLNSVFTSGPEFASSIHFPYTVINSVAGKTSEKLGLRGFGSSISSGGNEGLLAALHGCGIIRSGVHERCLIGVGDERSELSTKIDKAKGLDSSRFDRAEGSICIALSELSYAAENGLRVYAELRGFGTTFGGGIGSSDGEDALGFCMRDAIEQAALAADQIDFVLLNSVGRPGEQESEERCIRQLFQNVDVPVICLNDWIGYGESLSSMLHLVVAAELVSQGPFDHTSERLSAVSGIRWGNGLVVSSSINGNYAAAIVSRI